MSGWCHASKSREGNRWRGCKNWWSLEAARQVCTCFNIVIWELGGGGGGGDGEVLQSRSLWSGLGRESYSIV